MKKVSSVIAVVLLASVLAVLEPLADEVRDPHLAKLISMFKGAVR